MTFVAYAEDGIYYVFANPAIDSSRLCVTCVKNDEHTSHVLGTVERTMDEDSLVLWVARHIKAQNLSSVTRIA